VIRTARRASEYYDDDTYKFVSSVACLGLFGPNNAGRCFPRPLTCMACNRVEGLMHLVVFGIHDQAVRAFDVFVRGTRKAIRAANERSGDWKWGLASSDLTLLSSP